MKFGIAVEVDGEVRKIAPVVRDISNAISHYLTDKNYGEGVLEFYIGFRCFRRIPGAEHLFKEGRVKYVESKTVKLIDGSTKNVEKELTYNIVVSDEIFERLNDSSSAGLRSIVCEILGDSLIKLDKLPKKLKDFDVISFKEDFRLYLSQIIN